MGLKFGCGQLPGQGLVRLEQQAANLPGAHPALTSALEEKAPQGDPIPNGLAFRRPFCPAHRQLPAVLLRQPSNYVGISVYPIESDRLGFGDDALLSGNIES
ncbi:unnamed protein product [Cylindrotheca closterium]|uniref:Uncharacterized protein n=1 Tax=Cylindrotheca closterium TaxID=2856 RepID=A0AAD2G1K7_9STRA|nr:unnamed protein product [Cylindrotheca closterium]